MIDWPLRGICITHWGDCHLRNGLRSCVLLLLFFFCPKHSHQHHKFLSHLAHKVSLEQWAGKKDCLSRPTRSRRVGTSVRTKVNKNYWKGIKVNMPLKTSDSPGQWPYLVLRPTHTVECKHFTYHWPLIPFTSAPIATLLSVLIFAQHFSILPIRCVY